MCFVYFRKHLYSTSMVQSLSEKEFDLLTEEQLQAFDFMSVSDDGLEGYILEEETSNIWMKYTTSTTIILCAPNY